MTEPSRIDPRIRARRVAVARQRGRRRLRVVMAGIVLVAGAAMAWGASRSAVLDLDRVEVAAVHGGEVSARTQQAMAEAVGVPLGTPLVDIDTMAVAQNVAALPWVRSATVRRVWPGSIEVDVVERVAVATIYADGALALVDTDGVVLGIDAVAQTPDGTTASTAGLTTINSHLSVEVGQSQIDAVPAIRVVEALPADLKAWISTVNVAADGSVGLTLVGGVGVDMADANLVTDKLESLRAVLGRADRECVSQISVVVADQPVLTRDPGCLGSDPEEV